MQGPGEPLRPPAPSELADDLPSLPDDLARIDQALRDSVRTPDPFLAEVATHLIGAGGKRLRPTLTLCASYASTDGAGRPGAPDSVTGAVACELVHLGSLYHDDVIDEAVTRRGVPSVNARWSNIVAILAGDFLLARASSLAASLGADVAGLLAATIGELCRGQVLELQHLFDVDRSEEDYSSAIEGKTAALFATSCRIGGMVSGASDPTLDALTRFGRHLGMCFQIVDDVLDLSSTDAALGKHAGQDLLEGIYTLPVIYMLRESGELRELLGGPLDPDQLDDARTIALGTLSTGSTAVDVALDVARDHAVKAGDALEGADGLDPGVCRTLGRLVEGLVSRES
ncbi:MAG TPA: polyprenyl synthetase family protein [Acidimicrobiia bacterium]|jgi:heptaprenyl diphosphate synthase|nr:polyprenyl synthetase family protein [Acidimicrobiia bacterium]